MKDYKMPILKVIEFPEQLDVLTGSGEGDIEFPEVPLFSGTDIGETFIK